MHALLLLVMFFAAAAWAGDDRYGLAPGALIIEECSLPRTARGARALVLWMVKAEARARPGPPDPDYIPACPDYTRGAGTYWGKTRVSLIDTRKRKIINTVEIGTDKAHWLEIPFWTRADYSPYRVPSPDAHGEGKPVILDLRDYNGDGKALEFALFYGGASCMDLETTLIGYSEAHDRVVWYPVELTIKRRSRWADHLFSKPASAPGHWKYEIDYRGRAGPLDRFDVHYDRAKERFEGTVIEDADEADPLD